jgi:putative hemolysin
MARSTAGSSAPTACCGRSVATAAGGFYSEDEFELEQARRAPSRAQRFLELGRSCVLPEYRSKRTIEALWQGIWAYHEPLMASRS